MTLAIAQEARRQGAGTKLVQQFIERATEMDASRLFLEVSSLNRPAQSLYEGLGWQVAGQRRAYYGPDHDAIIMRYDLQATNSQKLGGSSAGDSNNQH